MNFDEVMSRKNCLTEVSHLQEPEADPVIVPVPDELAVRVKKILERFKEITKAWDDLSLDEADAPLRDEDEDLLPMSTTPHVDEHSHW
jgi:hypothetical protein